MCWQLAATGGSLPSLRGTQRTSAHPSSHPSRLYVCPNAYTAAAAAAAPEAAFAISLRPHRIAAPNFLCWTDGGCCRRHHHCHLPCPGGSRAAVHVYQYVSLFLEATHTHTHPGFIIFSPGHDVAAIDRKRNVGRPHQPTHTGCVVPRRPQHHTLRHCWLKKKDALLK